MTIFWALAIVAICGDIWIVATIWERVQTRRIEGVQQNAARLHELQVKSLPPPEGVATGEEVAQLRALVERLEGRVQSLSNRAELAKGGGRR